MKIPRQRLVKLFDSCGLAVPPDWKDEYLAGATMKLAWEWLDRLHEFQDPEDADLIELVIKSNKFEVGEPDKPPPTVIGSIITMLDEASAQNPASKTQILNRLCALFPDRNRDRMAVTVKNQVPARLRLDRHLNICANNLGYWLEKGDQ